MRNTRLPGHGLYSEGWPVIATPDREPGWQPGRHRGDIGRALCECGDRHKVYRDFSVDRDEAAELRACPDCTVTIYSACAGCGEHQFGSCPARARAALALAGTPEQTAIKEH